jgi:hypothetical protein
VGALSFALSLLQTVFLVPILLQRWGSERYGVWLALMAGVTMLQAFDLGHHNYVGNKFNMEFHVDMGAFRRTLGSSLLVAYVLGLLELGIGVVIVSIGALPRVLSLPASVVDEQSLPSGLMLLMTMWFLVGSAGGIVSRIMIPAGKLHVFQWTGILARASQFGAIAVVALAGGSIFDACLSFAVVRSVTALVEFWYIRRLLPDLYPWWRGANWHVGILGMRDSLSLTFIEMLRLMFSSGVVIFVSSMFSVAAVPSFTTLRTVTNTVTSAATILIFAVLPDIVRFHMTRQMGKVADALEGHWFLAGIIVNGGMVLILPIIEPIYGAWTRGRLQFDPVLFMLLLVATSLVNVGTGLNSYLAGINDVRAQVAVAVGRAATLFIVSYGLSSAIGIVSIGVGSVVAELVGSVILPLIFVNGRLARSGGGARMGRWGMALAPPLLLLILGSSLLALKMTLGWVAAGMLPALCVTYYLHWKGLPVGMRARIGSLVVSRVTRTRA